MMIPTRPLDRTTDQTDTLPPSDAAARRCVSVQGVPGDYALSARAAAANLLPRVLSILSCYDADERLFFSALLTALLVQQ